MMKQDPLQTEIRGGLPGFCPADCPVCDKKLQDYPTFSRFRSDPLSPARHSKSRHTRILFVMHGMLRITSERNEQFTLAAGECILLTRNTVFEINSVAESDITQLAFSNRVIICQDCLGQLPLKGCHIPDENPVLATHPQIEQMLKSLFLPQKLLECPCYHELKETELCMIMKACYTHQELIRFFRPMIRPKDDFRAFVLSYYTKATSIAQLSRMAGMGTTVFKQKFSETFNDTVHHWMVKQKALKIQQAVTRDHWSVKELMNAFGFKTYAHFNRFCKSHFGMTPSSLIARSTPNNPINYPEITSVDRIDNNIGRKDLRQENQPIIKPLSLP